jgi:cob(I)alamin adenosyltransferase
MAYGDVDELISYIGLIRAKLEPQMADKNQELRDIQCHLMNISAHLANDHTTSRLIPLDSEATSQLEDRLDEMAQLIEPQDSFILPSGPEIAAHCHVARTICRRCERSIVAICDRAAEDNVALRYINRLSDYLFTLARFLTFSADFCEDRW